MQERLATRLFARFNALDASGLADLFDENVTHTAPGSQFGAEITGRTALVAYFRDKVLASFQSLGFVVDRVYFDSQSQVELAEWHGDMLTRRGVPFSSRGIFVLELSNGRILHMREYFDTEKSKAAMTEDAARSSR
jgi:ketosteroid isomerase-like protein